MALLCVSGECGRRWDVRRLAARAADIPSLAWQERSDWINVKTRRHAAAVGDGQADDTAAIQAALDRGRNAEDGVSAARHVPHHARRWFSTGPAVGCLVVGHGRDTRLVWDGPAGGRMFWSRRRGL